MSSSGIPYIGSKISLISKAKIRYEGFLYTIDKKESTVTLAKVTSHGTEDRVPDNPIPSRDEVFEYIVFRGTDIEDLHVAEAPKAHTDPAIVQTGQAHANGYPPVSRGQMLPPNYPQFNGMPNPFGYSPFGYQNMLGGRGRVRSDSNRKVSPPSVHRSPTPEELSRGQSFGRSRHYSGSREDTDNRYRSQHQEKEREENRYNRERGHSDRERRDGESRNYQSRDKRSDFRRDDDQREYNRRDDRQEGRQQDGRRDSRREGGRHEQNRREHHRASSEERQSQSEDRSQREGQNRGSRNNQSRSFSKSNVTDKDKFKEDFDFESSNAKFNKDEIEKELLTVLKDSLKIKDEDEVIIEGDNNTLEDEKDKDEFESMPSPDKFYDRSKSFFDNISCEAMADKENEPSLTRRQERTLNVDTFGPVANSYRGFYRRGRGRGRGGRGRGQYRDQGRGRGGFSRGGMNQGNFRGGQNSKTWVDYEFNYEAAGLKNRNC